MNLLDVLRENERELARRTDPVTSHLAAAAQLPRLSAGREQALLALHRHGPSTDFELARYTGKKQTSIGCRRKDLERVGLVENSGTTRPSDTGSPAVVWQLTEAGVRAARERVS